MFQTAGQAQVSVIIRMFYFLIIAGSAAVSQITPGSWDTQRSASSVDVYSKNFTDGNFGIILMFWEVWHLTLFQNLT